MLTSRARGRPDRSGASYRLASIIHLRCEGATSLSDERRASTTKLQVPRSLPDGDDPSGPVKVRGASGAGRGVQAAPDVRQRPKRSCCPPRSGNSFWSGIYLHLQLGVLLQTETGSSLPASPRPVRRSISVPFNSREHRRDHATAVGLKSLAKRRDSTLTTNLSRPSEGPRLARTAHESHPALR